MILTSRQERFNVLFFSIFNVQVIVTFLYHKLKLKNYASYVETGENKKKC